MPHLQTMLTRLQHEHTTNPGIFRRVSFPAGRKFIVQGEPDTTVYLLLTGQATVSKTEPRGPRHELGRLTAPTLVGELSALVHGRTADVTAATDVEAVAMEAVVFRDMCIKYGDFAQAFSGLVHQRLAEQETIVEGSSRHEQIQVLANVQALALATPDSQGKGKILTALIELAEKNPDLIRRATYPASASEPFIRQGQALERVFVIVQGAADVHLPDGRTVRVGAGSPLGEIAALSPSGIATASVFLTEDTEMLSLAREHFRALREPAEELVRHRLNEQFTHPLSAETKETLRSVRDQNTDALILRSALDIVHSGTGIFRHLNPEQAGHEHGPDASGRIGIIRQKCVMISEVASLLKLGKRRDHIAGTIDEIKGYALSGIPALKMFKGDAALAREDWIEQVAGIFKPFLPNALSFVEFTTVRERLERLCWLDQLLLRDGAIEASLVPGDGLSDKLVTFLAAQEGVPPARIFDVIDRLFETLMASGIARGHPKTADDLKAVQFHKVEAALVEDPLFAREDLPREHPNYQALRDTRARLARGERSAIGGADYATQRFPEALLERIVDGIVKVVVYDGSRNRGVAYVIRRCLTGASIQGVRPQYMTTEAQGLDGSGGRTLITFRNGEQVLLLTGYGLARQRHNADSILLFERRGKRVPEEHLILASEGLSYVARIREDIQRALDGAPIPTQLLILQNPKEFETALGGPGTPGTEMHYASGALFDFYVGYGCDSDGVATRYIIPKVGGRGLYGDTAGSFVEAVFTAGIPQLGCHVIFNGTAGGFGETEHTPAFAGLRGLGAVKPGETLICPVASIAQYDSADNVSTMPMVTIFGEFVDGLPRDAETRRLFERMRGAVSFTSKHVAVGAPGDETYDLIRGLVAQGFASIDVEGWAIMAAVSRLNAERNGRPEVTFTPLYTFSDNPLHSEQDRYDSLAIMGPFFEGTRFNAELWNVLKDLLAFARRRAITGV